MEVDTTPPPLASTAAVGNAGAGAAGGTGAAGSSSSATTNMRRAEAGGAGRASPPASSLALLPSRKRRRSSQTSVSLSSAMLRQQQQYDVGGSIPSLWNAGWREHSWEASTCATRAALTPAQEETTSYSNEDHSSLSGYGCYQLDDNETPKRRNLTGVSDQAKEAASSTYQDHHFASLGTSSVDDELEREAMAADEYADTLSHYDGQRERLIRRMTDDGVDSPMHMLRLASQSPPDTLAQGHGMEVETSNPETVEAASFVPRQLRRTSKPQAHALGLSRSTHISAPYQPSPLALAAHTESAAPSMSSPSSSSMQLQELSTNEQPDDMEKQIQIEPRRDSQQPSELSFAHHSPLSEEVLRTPSPRPFSTTMSEDGGSGNSSSSRARGGSSSSDDGLEVRGRPVQREKANFSPGVSSSAHFPGGKQMLRYTMGFRHDCEQCQNRVPGHYGHVVHRA